MISIDWTFLASGLVFLFTLWALNRLLFRPLLAVLDERRSLTSERKEKARETDEYYESLFEKYSARIKQEKQAGYQLAESLRQEALEERQVKTAAARDQAAELLEEARKEVRQEMEQGKQRLQQEAREIAGLITDRILRSA